jgi:hypothetical protein
MFVVIAQDARGICKAAVGDENGWVREVGQDIRDLQQSLATRLVAGLDLTEVCDQRLQECAPCCKTSQNLETLVLNATTYLGSGWQGYQ